MSTRINPPGPVVLGSTVDLVCEASVGDLPINFTWTDPNGVSVNPTDTNGTISINLSSEDYDMYTCIATNEFGMNTAVVDVVIAGIVCSYCTVSRVQASYKSCCDSFTSTCSLSFCWTSKWLHCYS